MHDDRPDLGPLFAPRPPTPPCDPHIHRADISRVSGQTARIVDLLRRGPATNVELAAVSLKYTSRVSDARAAGYTIECERVRDGVTRYTLTGEP